MDNAIPRTVMFAELMDLGMAVVACGDAVIRTGGLDLVVFDFPVFEALFLEPGLQETATATAAKIVGAVGVHIDEVFFSDHRFDHIPEIFGYGITVTLADNLAGVLNGKLDFQVFVPVRVDLEPAFADPLGIVFINAFYFKIMCNVEFFSVQPGLRK